MKPRGMIAGIASALTLGVAALGAAAAHAESQGGLVLASNTLSGPSYAPAPRSTLEWDARKGRWGLKLGVEQHVGDVQLKDVQPGVFYRLTPRLHIGGAVSLAPDQVENQRLNDPQMPAPRVRLETTFKF